MSRTQSRSDIENAVTHGGADAGLYLRVATAFLLAAAQVADGAVEQRHDAGVADAHPAAGGHSGAGALAGVEQGGGSVDLDGLAGPGEGDLPGLAVDRQVRGEAFDGQPLVCALASPQPL